MEEGKKQEERKDSGALFIPAGVLIGLGVGFFIDNIPAALFVGLGIGFVLFALTRIFTKA